MLKFWEYFNNAVVDPMDGGAWWAAVHGVAKSRTRLNDFTFNFHALEKEMATHSSVLAWRIPGTEEPGGLPSMGSHRVEHDWSELAAAAADRLLIVLLKYMIYRHTTSPSFVVCLFVCFYFLRNWVIWNVFRVRTMITSYHWTIPTEMADIQLLLLKRKKEMATHSSTLA